MFNRKGRNVVHYMADETARKYRLEKLDLKPFGAS
jgi:hypothetical protein